MPANDSVMLGANIVATICIEYSLTNLDVEDIANLGKRAIDLIEENASYCYTKGLECKDDIDKVIKLDDIIQGIFSEIIGQDKLKDYKENEILKKYYDKLHMFFIERYEDGQAHRKDYERRHEFDDEYGAFDLGKYQSFTVNKIMNMITEQPESVMASLIKVINDSLDYAHFADSEYEYDDQIRMIIGDKRKQ